MESDEENDDFMGLNGTNGCIILIDVSPPMWKLIEDLRPIDVALNSCSELMKKVMINSPKQLMGISLFGTKKYDNPQGIENIIQLIELKEPSVDDIKKLKQLSSNCDDIIDQWGATDGFSLADALWQASRMFSSCSKKMSSQTLTLLSSLKEPDRSIHKIILKKASDAVALGININIINVSDEVIPGDSFFVELGKVINEQVISDWEPPEPQMDTDDILKLLWAPHHRKSASAVLKMYLGPDVVLGVGLYHLCKQRSAPKKCHLHRDTNDLVVSSSTFMKVPKEENAEEEDTPDNTPIPDPGVLQSDITYTVTYGGRKIELSKEEHIQLRKFAGTPSIKLLWFKPASALNMSEWFLSASAFVYPNESLVEGSSKLFLALRDGCLAQGRVAICLLVSRWFSNAKFVALVPQKRVMKGNCQIQPDGFHVVYLPYADNLKELTMDEQDEATPEQNACMENIINKLKFQFVGDMFENPKLQSLYKAIEALALDEPNPEEIEDTTLPDIEAQSERLGDLSEDFQTLFGPMNISSVKRPRNEETSNKKVATNDPEQIDGDMVVARLNNSTIEKFTVAQLKSILKNYIQKLPSLTGMKKDQLVKLVYENSRAISTSIKS